MPPNSPKETDEDLLSIDVKDVAQCENLEAFFRHPKFLQFLQCFNAQRRTSAGAVSTPREITADDLKNNPSLAREVYECFKTLPLQMSCNTAPLVQSTIDRALKLIERRYTLVGKLEEIDNEPFANIPLP